MRKNKYFTMEDPAATSLWMEPVRDIYGLVLSPTTFKHEEGFIVDSNANVEQVLVDSGWVLVDDFED